MIDEKQFTEGIELSEQITIACNACSINLFKRDFALVDCDFLSFKNELKLDKELLGVKEGEEQYDETPPSKIKSDQYDEQIQRMIDGKTSPNTERKAVKLLPVEDKIVEGNERNEKLPLRSPADRYGGLDD